MNNITVRVTNKAILREIKERSPEGSKIKNQIQFRRDMAAKKYLNRLKPESVLTKRTISELSPWNTKMIKTLTNEPFSNISEGLQIILKNGAPPEKIKEAFGFSSIFDRLANMKYYD